MLSGITAWFAIELSINQQANPSPLYQPASKAKPTLECIKYSVYLFIKILH